MTSYCSPICQLVDVPFHMRFCEKFQLVPQFPISDDGILAIDETNELICLADPVAWMASLHKHVVYHIAIDSYRMFIGAEHRFGNVQARYANLAGGIVSHFDHFLHMMQQGSGSPGSRGVLPAWWTEQDMVGCLKFAMDEKGAECILHWHLWAEDLQAILRRKYRNDLMPEYLMGVLKTTFGPLTGESTGTVAPIGSSGMTATQIKIHRPKTCTISTCTPKGPLMKCSSCRKAYYCSRACQVEDWPTHKKTCNKPSLPLASQTPQGNLQQGDIAGLESFAG